MSETVDAVLFRADTTSPEWVQVGEFDAHEMLGCKTIEYIPLSSRLCFILEKNADVAGREKNKCIETYVPCKDGARYFGNALLVAYNYETPDDVTAADLDSLKTILSAEC